MIYGHSLLGYGCSAACIITNENSFYGLSAAWAQFVCWHLLCMIWIASLCMFICETFNNEIRFDYYLHSDSHLNAYIFLIWNLLSMSPLFIPVVYFEQCLKYKRPLLSFYIFVLSILFFYNCFEQLLVCPFHSPKPMVFSYINGHLYTLL
jgi:hypothetical protein